MTVDNPFADSAPTEQEDENLVVRARADDRKALEDLIERHQAWIYNIALRMLFHPQDAEDYAGDPYQDTNPALVVRGPEQLPHLALPHRC
jgi:hypothetical protein